MAIIPVNIENLKPNKEYIVTVRSKNNDVNVVSPYTDSVRFFTPTDSTIPGAPTNLVLAASFLNVLFKYTDSVDEDTAKYEYELYKQEQIESVGGQYQVISSATPLTPHRTGFVQTNVFLVSVDDNSTTTSTSSTTNPVKYYGRVRSIDSAGNIGDWTNIVASGDTPLIDEEFIGSLTAAKITAGTIGAHEIILTQPGTATTIISPDNKAILRSSDYNGSYNNTTDTWSAGTAGWIISGDGRAEFNNATIRGTLQFIDGSAPGSIYYGATQPSIPSPFTAKLISAISGNGTSVTYTTGTTAHGLSVGKIISLNNVIPSQYNLKNQYVTAVTTYTFTISSSATGTFDPIYSVGAEVVAGQIPEYSIWYNSTSGDNKSYIYSSSTWNQSLANVSNLSPQNQTQTGLIAGTTITGGGITLSAGGNIKGGQTAYDTGTGFFLGYSSSAYRFSIGNSSGNKLTWDGTNLNVTGAINATSGTFSGTITASGTISGGTITGASITGSTLTTAASGNRVNINTNDITLYYNGNDVSNINFSGNSIYSSSIVSDGSIRLRGYGSVGEVKVGIKPNLRLGTYIYGSQGVEVNGGSDSDDATYGHLMIYGSSGNEANLSLLCNNTHIQLRAANNNSTLYLRRANDTAYADLELNILRNQGAGIVFAGSTVGGGAANQMGMSWANPNILGTVDNVVSAVLGTVSDRRVKTNIETFTSGLSELQNLRVVKYNPYVVTEFTEDGPTVSGVVEQTMVGLIADEVEQVAPWLVQGTASKRELQSVNYALITPLLINAIKEINERLEVLENK